MTEQKKKIPWLVHVYARLRTFSFVLLFCATALHIYGRGYGLLAWGLLVLLLFVYPPLQYLRSLRSRDPLRTEMNNLTIDSVLLGMYIAGVGFSQWLMYSAMLGTMVNNVVNKSWRGLLESGLGLSVGILLWSAIAGFRFTPETNWSATLFCIVGLTLYVLLTNNATYIRTVQLREVREQLRRQRQDLLAANDETQRQLMRIDGMRQQMQGQVNQDPLTGLYNRRYLDSTLPRELTRCRREGQPLCLILVGIDRAGPADFDDGGGRQASDRMLTQLADVLNDIARAGDAVCRHGEDEFVVLAPAMSLEEAARRAQALRSAIDNMGLPEQDGPLTISAGIAAFPLHTVSAEDLIVYADDALYRARSMGGNRVEVADSDAGTHERG